MNSEKLCGMCCERKQNVMQRTLNTQYHNEESNVIESCWDCFAEVWSDYDSLWCDTTGGYSPFPHDPPIDESERWESVQQELRTL